MDAPLALTRMHLLFPGNTVSRKRLFPPLSGHSDRFDWQHQVGNPATQHSSAQLQEDQPRVVSGFPSGTASDPCNDHVNTRAVKPLAV